MEEITPIGSVTAEPGSFGLIGIIAAIVLLIIGAGAAGFFILRKKKNGAAVPPSQNDGQPTSPSALPQPDLALKCVGGALNGKSCPIADGLCIGSDAARCKVVYPGSEPGISGIHCKITQANGQAQLIDMNSSAGTFINGVPILPNMPYSMPIGSSFYIGSPNNIFVIAENTARPKKRFPWIAIVSVIAVIAAAILFFLLGRKTYTGVTGKTFTVPSVGFANLVFDGKEQTNKAKYATNHPGDGWGRDEADKHLSVSLGEDRFIAWDINTSSVVWEEGASFGLKELSDDDRENWISAICDEVNYCYSLGYGLDFFDEANLTVLELNGDKIAFYFYLKLRNNIGESHTLEGVARAVLDQGAFPDTYTGDSGKTFAIPDVGSANFIYDGQEMTDKAGYFVNFDDDVPMNSRGMDVDLDEGMFGEWSYAQWDFDITKIPWKTGESFDLKDFDERNYRGIRFSMSCYGIHYYNEDLEEAVLTVLDLDGDEFTFYFRVKFSYVGATHTLEGVARTVLIPWS